MPDQFSNDPAPNTATAPNPSSEPSLIEQLKLGLAATAKSFRIDMWLARHTPATVLPALNKVLDALQDEFADAVSNGGGVYGVGYCFGAKYVLLLASEVQADVAQGERAADEHGAAEEGMVRRGPRLKAGAVAHGTLVGREDLENLAAPVGIVAVKGDGLFPDEVREEGVKRARERGAEVQEWVYEDVPHGESEADKLWDRGAREGRYTHMHGFADCGE